MPDHDSPSPEPVNERPALAGETGSSSERLAEPTPLPAEATKEPDVDLDFHADGIDHMLDPNWILATRLVGGIAVAIFSGINLIGLLIAVFVSNWRGWSVPLAFGGWFLLAGAWLTWAQISPALHYKRRRYRLDEVGLRIRRGLLFHAEISIPQSRIQHTDVSRGPIERWFGLATLIVHTAGTENASVSLDGLPSARAYRIRDLLLVDAETGDAV